MAASTTLASAAGRLEQVRGLLGANPALLPGLVAVAIFVALAGSEAGFYPIGSDQRPGLGWYPAGVLLLALLGASVIAVRPERPPRAVALALTGLAGYTAWSFLSITWAEQQGVAWDGANRTAIYLVTFALFALWPLTARGATILLGALGLGLTALGLVELLKADAAAEPILYLVDARFAEPAGYINANVAVWTIGLFPCLHLAATREAHPLLRGLGLGGAGVLACLALMGQSRGWVLALPVAALVFVVVMPGRARALAALGAVAVGASVVSGSLLAVHDDFTPETLDGLLATAARNVLLLAGALAILGTAAALADRRVDLSRAQSRRANRAAMAALALTLVVGAGAGLAAAGDPVERLSDSWQSFKDGGEATAAGTSRFTSVGTNRYDFWTVAWDRFGDRPLWGIGSENFQQDYLARGNSGEQPRYPHSLVLGVLSQTGLVGALLLGGALLAAALGGLRGLRRAGPEAAAVAGVVAAVFVYWLVHASVDWFWEFAGVTAPAMAMLGVACAVGRRRGHGEADRGPARVRLRRLPGATAPVASGVTGILLLVSLVLPWLAEREVDRAASDWRSAPATAFERLRRAEKLNPLSPRPHLTAATIAVQVEDQARATTELEHVLALEPRTPFALAELAALASERGQVGRAKRLLERASSYAPNDGVVTSSLNRVRSGGSIDVRQLNASYLEAARSRTGRE